MKSLIVAALITFGASSSFADQYVNSYYRKDGTYVQGYTRSNSNNTVTDNYSFKGNTNPYTGETGTNYYRNNPTSPYYNGGSNPYRSNSGSSNYGYGQYR